jgi:uncharacterized protein
MRRTYTLGPMDGFLPPERVRGLFDRAVVHFNERRFFESHEDWETLWHEAEGAHREWLQGLIQVAAALHHVGHGTASGFQKLMRSARAKMTGYRGDAHGIDLGRLWDDLQPWFAHGEAVAAGAPVCGPAMPPFPTIGYAPGTTPAPLPLDEVVEE